mgnify:CR=1 FL=1
MKIINDIKEDGKTILIATHDINNIEDKFDEVLCLNRHCCAFGDPSDVLTEEIIEEMYKKIVTGYDVVYAKRRSRKGETFLKKIISSTGYYIINNCLLYTSDAADE